MTPADLQQDHLARSPALASHNPRQLILAVS